MLERDFVELPAAIRFLTFTVFMSKESRRPYDGRSVIFDTIELNLSLRPGGGGVFTANSCLVDRAPRSLHGSGTIAKNNEHGFT